MSLNRPFALGFGALALASTVAVGCRSLPAPEAPTAIGNDCMARAVFPPPEGSPYCLPLAEGTTSLVGQAYCSEVGWSHRGRFAYDFVCDYGDEIRAARGGFVDFVGDAWPDDDSRSGHENRAVIVHSDGTVAFYAHFQQDSLVVVSGDHVQVGQLLGRCGSSGTPSVPHLHFEIFERAAYEWERGLPVSFRNASGPLDERGGLDVGAIYTAETCGLD